MCFTQIVVTSYPGVCWECVIYGVAKTFVTEEDHVASLIEWAA